MRSRSAAAIVIAITLSTASISDAVADVASGDTHAGPALSAEFRGLDDLAVDATGDVYVADGGNAEVDRIRADGQLEIVAGTGVRQPATPGPAAASSLDGVRAVAVSPEGDLYISDADHLLKVDSQGMLSIVADLHPMHMAFAPDGTLYFDRPCGLDKRTPDGVISTVVPPALDNGSCDETRNSFSVTGLAVGSDGQVYVADYWGADQGYLIRVSADGTQSPVLGGHWESPTTPESVAVDSAGNIFTQGPVGITEIAADGTFRTLASGPSDTFPYTNLRGIAAASDGSVYVLDAVRSQVIRATPQGQTSVVAGDGAIPNLRRPFVSATPPQSDSPDSGTYVSGKVSVGQTLYANTGSWGGPSPVIWDISLTFEWLVNGQTAGTGPSFTVPASAAGGTIAYRADYSARTMWGYPTVPTYTPGWAMTDEVSVAAPAVVRTPPHLRVTSLPRLRGRFVVGQSVNVSAGSWSTPVHLSYRWRLGKKTIPHATSAHLSLRKAFAGQRLSVVVTATSRDAGSATVAVSGRVVRTRS